MSLLTGESGDLRIPDGQQEHRKQVQLRVSGRPGPPSDPATNWSSSPPAARLEHQVRALRRSHGRHLQGLLPGWHCSVSWDKKNNLVKWLKICGHQVGHLETGDTDGEHKTSIFVRKYLQPLYLYFWQYLPPCDSFEQWHLFCRNGLKEETLHMETKSHSAETNVIAHEVPHS